MKNFYRYFFAAIAILFAFSAHSQSIFPFSGSSKGGNSIFTFYNPLVSGGKTFKNSIISSGPIQLLADTTAILDTTLQTYDLDSIPEQLVFYNTPCRFYLKSDSLNRIAKAVINRSYYVTEGKPQGVIQFNRINQFQYTTNLDTLDFSLQFVLVTSTGDTIRSKKSVKFKVIPTLPYETFTFGLGGEKGLPDPNGTEFRVQTIDTSTLNSTFNFQSVNLRTISYSGVNVVLENNSPYNQLYLKNNNPNIKTLNIYAETLTIKGGFRFPGTTINIYAKDLKFEDDVNGAPAFLSTLPLSDPLKKTGEQGLKGERAGDIHLHILNFTANPGKRFILNGGDGQDSDQKIGDGGDGGSLYSTIDLSEYMLSEGGYSGNKKYALPAIYKGSNGAFILDSNYASWLHHNFLHIIKNYNKEGFYAGATEAVVKNLSYYSDIIVKYTSDTSIFKLGDDNLLQVQQIADEINQVFYNIANNLDYYGNPPGWVPMLSFELTKAAYNSEVSHALNVLFLDQLIQNANNSLVKRREAFTQLRSEASTIVDNNRAQYTNLAFTVIPEINDKIIENQNRIAALKEALVAISAELDNRAQKKYKERQTWKWVGVAAKVLSAIPTPYTQVAGAALTVGTKVFGTEDQKAGFDQSAGLTETIKATLEPFTSGQVTSDVSTLGTNVSNGVSSIFSKIPGIKSKEDIKKIGEESKKLYDDNKERFQSVSKSVTAAVDLFNQVTRIGSDELSSIKGELLANEPRIGAIAEEMKNIADDQQKLGQRLETAINEMIISKTTVYTGLTAISHFNDEVFDASSAYDHTLSVFSNDMRRRAFDRVRKYHYYMLKAYEYRAVDTTLGSLWRLNLNTVLEKIENLITANHTSLSPADFASLKSSYDEEIHQIAEKIYDYYLNNQAGKTSTAKIRLTSEEIKSLNSGQEITINLVDKGLFPPGREDLRLGNLQVSKIVLDTVINPNTGLHDQLNFRFDYPNYSRIKKNGMAYSFNNYSLHTQQNISWGTDYDLYSKSYTAVTTSDAEKSLLSSLFEGTSGATKVELFARPAAWADIKLSMEHITDGASEVTLDSLFIDVQYDFQFKPANIVNVELNTSNKWFTPTFAINKIDKYNRKSGIGNVHRAYAKSSSASNNLTVIAPKNYGRYSFTNWATQAGVTLTNGDGIDISGGNTLKFSLAADRSFKAVYKFEGAILNVPDTVYLGDTLRYTLHIKNTGTGPLLWTFDSSSNWIKYPVKSGVNDSTLVLHFDANPDSTNTRMGVLDVSSTETELLHNYIYFIQNKGTVKPNTPPVVSIVSPLDNAVYSAPATITLKATATDPDTIGSVQFYKGATLLKTDSTKPYDYTFKITSPGNYSFTAKATDKKGLSAISQILHVKVIANKAPVIKITTDDSVYTSPGKITISAQASDSDGTIQYVQFYNGATLLYTDSANKASYAYSWINVPAGSYSLTAKATDNRGLTTTSAVVHVTVTANNTLEAEDAVLNGAVVASGMPGFTGTGYADYVHASGDFIEWTFNAPSAGKLLLQFRYANGSDNRPLQLKVNGVVVESTLDFLPTGGWATWSVSSTTANLIAGTNKIRLTAIGLNGPNVDHLALNSAPAIQARSTSQKGISNSPGFLKAYVSPNPAAGNAQLVLSTSSDLPVNFQLVDMLGRTYKSVRFLPKGSNIFNFSVNDLPSGSYIVVLKQGNLSTHTRLIVTKK